MAIRRLALPSAALAAPALLAALLASPASAQAQGSLGASVSELTMQVGDTAHIGFGATFADGTGADDVGPVTLAFPRGSFEWEGTPLGI